MRILILLSLVFILSACGEENGSAPLASQCAGKNTITDDFEDSYIFFDDCTGFTKACSLYFNYFTVENELHLTTNQSLNGVLIDCIAPKDATCTIQDLNPGHEMICIKGNGE